LRRCKGDAVRLSQVVVNLLTNAANYTPVGGQIEVSLVADAGEAVVRVKDNGIGIASDMVGRIFEPYQQAGQSSERSTGGLGLGLTVSRRLIEMHGGSVEARSSGLGRGSEHGGCSSSTTIAMRSSRSRGCSRCGVTT
jgi:signal transduction histidine kinase